MAFTRATDKFRSMTRRQRHGAGVVGAAALVAAIAGPLATPAAAAVSATVQNETGLTQAMAVSNPISDRIGDQADAQDEAAAGSDEEQKSSGDEGKKSDEDKKEDKADDADKSDADKSDDDADKADKKADAEKKADKERGDKKRSDRTAERAKLNAFVSPVSGSKVTTQYNSGGAMWSSGSHSGIDFAAAEGTPVQSAGAGTVVEAGWGGAYGNNIVVKHNDGKFTQYGHLSKMDVTVGQKLTSGQDIGRVGSTGNSTGPHLHFEARTAASYGSDVNPIDYLRGKGVGLG